MEVPSCTAASVEVTVRQQLVKLTHHLVPTLNILGSPQLISLSPRCNDYGLQLLLRAMLDETPTSFLLQIVENIERAIFGGICGAHLVSG
jgi:hypothetical protein